MDRHVIRDRLLESRAARAALPTVSQVPVDQGRARFTQLAIQREDQFIIGYMGFRLHLSPHCYIPCAHALFKFFSKNQA